MAERRVIRLSDDLALPANTVTSTLVVYGGKGMGKTNFGSVEVEEFDAAGLRFAVIDPLGVWWGLRHSADGKEPGVQVLILGGLHGDLPIEPTAGAVVADLVVDEDVNVIIDISRRSVGTMWSHGERIRFVADYCTRLFERQGEQRRPIHQVIDEAGRFVPEQIPSGAVDLARCVGAIEQLVEWGRNVGVGVTLITQRSARMKKSVSELADCMVAFRTVGPRSIDAILDWFGEHIPKERWRELVERLRQLPVGTALVVSPGWLNFEGAARIRLRRTFDSSATPEAGEAPRQPTGKAAKPDLTKYQLRMADTVERAKENDPRELRKRIAALERQLREQGGQRNGDVARLIERQQTDLAAAQRHVQQLQAALRDLVEPVQAIVRGVNAALGNVDVIEAPAAAHTRPNVVRLPDADASPPRAVPAIPPVPREHRRPPPSSPAPRPQPVPPPNSGGVAPSEQKLLDVLADMEALGLGATQRATLGAFSGYSASGGRFQNLLGRLRSSGLIEYPSSGTVALTEAGRAVANPSAAVRTLEDLHQAWYRQIGPSAARVLAALVETYPEDVSREELAERTGYEARGGRFQNILGQLRSATAIDYPGVGRVRATEVLFPNLPSRA